MLIHSTGKKKKLDCLRKPIGREPVCKKKGKVTQSRGRTAYRVGELPIVSEAAKWASTNEAFFNSTSMQPPPYQ